MTAALLLLFLAGPTSALEQPSPALLGSGLLTLPDTRTLQPGRVTLAVTLHNRDRDPLGLDVFDYSGAFTVGITPRMEAYGRGVFSRVVVVPDVFGTSPALPPPPLDLVLPRGAQVPARPYYPIYAPFPYANGRGDDRFTNFVPGDFVGGVKMRLREPLGRRPGLAVSGELQVPLTKRLGALESGSGTGGIDASLRLTSEWRLGRFDAVASAEFTRVGAPSLADRIVIADRVEATVLREPLRLPSRIELGGSLRRSLRPRLAAVAEVVATLEVGGRTKTLDAAPPLDGLLGIQTRAGHVRLTAGLLYHGRSLSSGDVRPSPLAGFVDLTASSDADARAYLERIGLGSAGSQLRPGVQRAAPRLPGVALPPLARVIPDSYTILSEHQFGFVVVLGWAF